MSVLRMVFKEIWHRKVNFLLAVLAVATAAAFFVAFLTAARASERETARLMLSMGYNLHVIARQASVDSFLMTGIADKTMPQTYLDALASQQSVSYNHLLATLDGRTSLRGMDILLTGVSPEICPPGQKKQPMTFEISPGTAYVGYRVVQTLGIQKGDAIALNGTELRVER
jgi:putative ABC transport system permease protein